MLYSLALPAYFPRLLRRLLSFLELGGEVDKTWKLSRSSGLWSVYLAFLSLSLLSGCGSSSVVTPEKEQYSQAFEEQLANELEEMTRPCDRLEPVGECSASARVILDYYYSRDQIDAVSNNE